MKIQYCSDLHLEFPENEAFLKANPLQINGDILILAGDIVPFRVMDNYNDFFDFFSDNYKYTYWIPGNHEYYYCDIAEKGTVINEKIRENVFLVNNISVIHDNIKFIFSTLWTKIRSAYEWQIEKSLSDFHVIKYQGKRFSAAKFNLLFEESLEFIKQEVNGENPEKLVTVSHHVPTFLNYPEQYKGDVLNDAFAVELFDFIEKSDIDYWIFGHHHENTPGFMIGNTKMLTNQLGYVKYNENILFNKGKYFIVTC